MAHAYADFSQSENGQFQHRLIWEALNPYLTGLPANTKFLDAGCGDGWLAGELARQFPSVTGIDISEELIEIASVDYPTLKFIAHDLVDKLPFERNYFDAAVLNMVLHNIENQKDAADNLADVIKPDGLLFVILPNPYYALPVGTWKKSLLGKLFGGKPHLTLQPYVKYLRGVRDFWWNPLAHKEKIPSRFSPLPEQINNLISAGFSLEKMQEIMSNQDSEEFNLDYKASRFPIFLLLVLKKLG